MKLLFAISVATILIFDMPVKNLPEPQYSINWKQNDLEQKPLFSFGLIADVHYADYNPVGNRYYRSSIEKLQEAITSFRDDSVNFIVNLGDLIESDYESYKPVLNEINSSGIKTYHITGNHDYSVDPRYLSRLLVFTESREGYYSIIYQKYRFIFINGNEISKYASANKTMIREADDYISKLKIKGEINAIDWNGGTSSLQLNWINGQLDESSDNSEKVILFCHFPIVPENIHNLLNYRDVYGIISKYGNIIAWFSGHNHEGNYSSYNKIHFVTFKGMVETKKSNSFAIIEVYENKITIKGYGREDSRVLNF
jgi:manganese-dependent ADP-ribose/CDP-alcohol diphosphatase